MLPAVTGVVPLLVKVKLATLLTVVLKGLDVKVPGVVVVVAVAVFWYVPAEVAGSTVPFTVMVTWLVAPGRMVPKAMFKTLPEKLPEPPLLAVQVPLNTLNGNVSLT